MASARDIKALDLIELECTLNYKIVILIILLNTYSIITLYIYNTFVTLSPPRLAMFLSLHEEVKVNDVNLF